MITLSQRIEIEQNYVILILIALLFILKLKIFLKIFPMMLRYGMLRLIKMMKMIKDLFQKVKIKKVIDMFKDELGGRIMKEFCAFKAKTYLYLMHDDSEVKKCKGTKKCVIKREIMFEYYTDCLFNDKIILKLQQRFKSDHHKVYTEEVNKIALSSDDDKRLQTFDRIKIYPYGTNTFKVCESEMLMVKDLFFEKLQWNSVTTININDQLWWLR